MTLGCNNGYDGMPPGGQSNKRAADWCQLRLAIRVRLKEGEPPSSRRQPRKCRALPALPKAFKED